MRIPAALLLLALLAPPAGAATLVFTSQAAFLAALPGPATTLDFETPAAGTLVPDGSSLGGVVFDYEIPPGSGGLTMAVVANFDTTSGSQSLGLDDPGNFDQFLDGDAFDLVFASPVLAVGFYLVSGDPLVAGDVEIQTAVGNAANAAAPDLVLPDGGLAHFIGLVSSDPFSTAAVRFDGGDHFFFNVDDLTWVVPEPRGLVAWAAAAWFALAPGIGRRGRSGRGGTR